MRRYQLSLLIALSLGMTGCQSSGSSSPSTWSWNPWASKDTAVAKSDAKGPALPSTEVAKDSKNTTVASRTTPSTTTPPVYPSTGAPPANYGAPQQGAYAANGPAPAQPGAYPTQPANAYASAAQPAPAYGAQPAYGAAPASGYPNTTVAAGYTANGFGGYGQPAAATNPAPAAPTGYGPSPTAYGTTPPASYGTTPAYGTVPSAYGQQPNSGNNPYAQPPAQPGATPGYGQGASYDPNNPSSAFGPGGFNQTGAAAPARSTAQFMPGSIKPMTTSGTGATGSVTPAGYDAKQGDAMATATTAYGTTSAGANCENGVCYPNGNTTTSASAMGGYQQPAASPAVFNNAAPAPSASPTGTIYR